MADAGALIAASAKRGRMKAFINLLPHLRLLATFGTEVYPKVTVIVGICGSFSNNYIGSVNDQNDTCGLLAWLDLINGRA